MDKPPISQPRGGSDPGGILIADDDAIVRCVLQKSLQKWEYRVFVAENGVEAWNILQSDDAPKMAILDWMMPGMDGIEVCRRVRCRSDGPYRYILLLTAKDRVDDVVSGLDAGADDYLIKPFNADEMRARVRAGMRILDLQQRLVQANIELAEHAAEEKRLETQLREAHKLEALGTMAGGVAHEINTPIQFVGDNLRFLEEGFAAIQHRLREYEESLESSSSAAGTSPEQSEGAGPAADLEFLKEEIPKAISQSMVGVSRVAAIVRAMKQFVQPVGESHHTLDLNEVIRSTLILASNEVRDVADVEEDLGSLPAVFGCTSDLHRVFLDLVVNAADAIKDVIGVNGKKGKIRVISRADGDFAKVSIADTGCGIPENIRERIFDPFFTTKAVGQGTGQGLTLARAIIVENHHGTLTFTTEVGRGTTFVVRLPFNGAS